MHQKHLPVDVPKGSTFWSNVKPSAYEINAVIGKDKGWGAGCHTNGVNILDSSGIRYVDFTGNTVSATANWKYDHSNLADLWAVVLCKLDVQ